MCTVTVLCTLPNNLTTVKVSEESYNCENTNKAMLRRIATRAATWVKREEVYV